MYTFNFYTLDLNTLSKAKAKYIRSLHTLKHRQKYNKYIAEGHKICKEIIISNASQIQHIVATENWILENQKLWHTLEDITFIASSVDFKQISTLSTPTEVLLVTEKPYFDDKVSLKDTRLMIYLDGIRNPGNMGAILRIADWYGMDKVSCSSDCVDLYNPKVIQSSMGSFLRVQALEKGLDELKEKGFVIYGSAMKGKPILELETHQQVVLVIGNEGKGISVEAKTLVDYWVTIDGSKRIGAESLNAAVATGILIDQISRKKDN